MTKHRATVAYARISKDASGEAAGVGSQLQDIRVMAASRGLTVDRELVDNDISAASLRGRAAKARPAYEDLMQLVAAGQVGAILVRNLDRLFRGRRQRTEGLELLQRHGVSLLCVKGPDMDLSSSHGRFIANLLGELATLEVELMSEREQRAMLRRVEAGAPPTGPRAYGYSTDGWTLVDDEAAVVRWIFEQFNAGASLSGLATDLNQRSIPSRSGKPWRHNGVRHLLGSERYAALRVHQGRTYVGKWPAIVTEDVLRTAQQRLADPSRTTSPGPASVHLLTGLADCGVPGCVNPGDTDGGPYRVTSGSRGKGQPVYQCSHGKVKHLVRAAPRINDFVEAVLLDRLAAADVAALMTAGDGSDELADARRQAVALRSKLDGLAALLADPDGDMDPVAYRDAVRAVQGRLATVEAKLADGERGRVLAPFADGQDPRAVWDGLGLDRQRAVVALLLNVSILPAARASKHRFDPSTIAVTWKGGPVVVQSADAVTLDGLEADVADDLASALASGGWTVQRPSAGCVVVPAQAVATARQAADDAARWGLVYDLPPTSAVREAVRGVVEQAPALTDEQRDRLAGLLG